MNRSRAAQGVPACGKDLAIEIQDAPRLKTTRVPAAIQHFFQFLPLETLRGRRGVNDLGRHPSIDLRFHT